jgi:hypothetical protein
MPLKLKKNIQVGYSENLGGKNGALAVTVEHEGKSYRKYISLEVDPNSVEWRKVKSGQQAF